MTVAQTVLELPSSVRWLTPGVSSLADYQGHPLALAFVNPASSWCQQRLMDLERWQRRNPGMLQVLVVMVPRFDFEADPQRSLALVRRTGSTADVAMDPQWRAWSALGLKQWPTLLLLDVAGREVDRLVGGAAPLEKALVALCEGGRPRVLNRPGSGLPQGLLAPMGLAASEDRLYIADSGHHRVLECNFDGRVLRRFGMGQADLIDGDGPEAAFRHPQSLAMDRNALYVADTGNHAVRRIDLLSGRVDTLVGTGQQGEVVEGVLHQAGGSPLSQPTAVAVAGNNLVIAQAGDNRLWSLELGTRELSLCTGAGALGLRDGGQMLAAFAQPTALVAVNKAVYVCDALASAIRSVQLREGVVQTLVGQGLADFGDTDGERAQARLQYPLALAMEPDSPWLWIADAGNGRLRRLRLGGGGLVTEDLPRPVHGVAGLAAANGVLWIADTDGNALLRYDPATGILADVPTGE